MTKTRQLILHSLLVCSSASLCASTSSRSLSESSFVFSESEEGLTVRQVEQKKEKAKEWGANFKIDTIIEQNNNRYQAEQFNKKLNAQPAKKQLSWKKRMGSFFGFSNKKVEQKKPVVWDLQDTSTLGAGQTPKQKPKMYGTFNGNGEFTSKKRWYHFFRKNK